jgi:D-arabinose 1-dehydrogenase-like Zn-dependent alcohol dehydrogenase
MDSKHPTYTIVSDPKEADACGWGFFEQDPNKMEKLYFKFPPLKDNELRINITYAGLCHSDLHQMSADWGQIKNFPIIPGHETVGEVTHVGSEVTDFNVGDKVGIGCFRDFCGSCKMCKRGDDNFCRSVDQVLTYGDLYWGGYATALQHPAKMFFKLPENLPEESIAPLFCAGITSFNPVDLYCKPGDEVAIIGIGGVGHMGLQYAKAKGCKVTAFTTSKGKDELYKKLGADRIVVTTEEGALQKEAGKYDVLFNNLPTCTQEMFNNFSSLLDNKGTWVQLGAPEVSETVTFSLPALVFGSKRFVGSGVGAKHTIQAMLDYSSKHNIVPLCEQFDFESFPKAWDHIRHGKPVFRCVVKCKDAFKKE